MSEKKLSDEEIRRIAEGIVERLRLDDGHFATNKLCQPIRQYFKVGTLQQASPPKMSIIPAIKSLKLRNFGCINKLDARFKHGINVIFGSRGSGRTTVVNALQHALKGEKLVYGKSRDSKPSEKAVIEIEIMGKITKEVKEEKPVWEEWLRKGRTPTGRKVETIEEVTYALHSGEQHLYDIAEALQAAGKGQAVLIDDIDYTFFPLSAKNRELFVKMLKESGLQVIITARHESELMKGANVIRLD